jgi:hypothetical protein
VKIIFIYYYNEKGKTTWIDDFRQKLNLNHPSLSTKEEDKNKRGERSSVDFSQSGLDTYY